MRLLPVLLLTLLVLPAAASQRDHFRCGKTFVRVGAAKYEVLRACGEPVYREVISGSEERKVEVWVYESDWSAFPRQLTFDGDRLRRIERLDRQ